MTDQDIYPTPSTSSVHPIIISCVLASMTPWDPQNIQPGFWVNPLVEAYTDDQTPSSYSLSQTYLLGSYTEYQPAIVAQIQELYFDFVNNQRFLPPDVEEILDQHISELYES